MPVQIMEEKKRKAEKAPEDTSENAAEGSSDIPEVDIAELAETLSKEQLVSLVTQAALVNAKVLSRLRKLADQDTAARKIFVRGLSWTTENGPFKKAFEEYGFVKKAVVVTDKSTGKSKGFGFVTFRHRDAAIRALKEPFKTIEGRKTICSLSASAPSPLQVNPETAAARRTIYVVNVPKKTMKKNTVSDFFSQYGEIEEGPLGFDSKSGKSKGYTLIKYKSVESVRECLKEPVKMIDGHKVQCKLAEPKKSKDEGVKPAVSSIGYDLTNPALIASHNPSFLQSSSHRFGLSSLHGIDPFRSQSLLLLPPDSAYASSSLTSMHGLPSSDYGALSSSYPSLTMMHDRQVSGYSSLPRGYFDH